MYSINRCVAIIKPKQPYLDWAHSLPDETSRFTLDELRSDCTAILLPEYDLEEDGHALIREIYSEIFEMELRAWYTDDNRWPENRDYKTFLEWFDIEYHSIVVDPLDEEIQKEIF